VIANQDGTVKNQKLQTVIEEAVLPHISARTARHFRKASNSSEISLERVPSGVSCQLYVGGTGKCPWLQ
jgi:hypothetical protein